MTDKQIIIDEKIKPITLEDVPTILELHKSKSFVEIAKMYGVTQNAIRYWVKKYNVKPLKQKDQIKILEEQLKRAEKTMQEIWDRLGKTSDELLRKEQECKNLREDIKDIARLLELDTGEEYNFGNIESAIKNYCFDCDVAERMRKVTYAATGGRLSYANYTVEAIEQAYNDQLRIDVEYRTKELEEQLDQLKEELAISIQENEEGREINAELKAENDTYKKMLEDEEVILALTEIRTGERHLWFNKAEQLKQTLAEIKEIAITGLEGFCPKCSRKECEDNNCIETAIRDILQKISECEVENVANN